MMMRALLLLVTLAVTCSAFAPQPSQSHVVRSKTTTSLEMVNKQTAASFVAAAFLAANVATAAPAFAGTLDTSSSTQVIAGRSGGRMGGRSSMGGMSRSYSSPGRGYSGYSPGRSTTYRSSTTIVRPMIAPPIMVSPFGYGYGYNPMGGFGTFFKNTTHLAHTVSTHAV